MKVRHLRADEAGRHLVSIDAKRTSPLASRNRGWGCGRSANSMVRGDRGIH